MKEMLKVTWIGTDGSLVQKICDSKILLMDFVESLNDEEFSSFKQRFKYGFKIKVEKMFSTATR